MVNGIKSILDVLKHNIKKDDIFKNMDFTTKLIVDDIIPTLESLSKSKLKAIHNNKMIVSLGKMCNIRGNAIEGFLDFFKQARDMMYFLVRFVDTKFPTIVTEATVTGQSGVVIKVVTDVSSMATYVLDFLNFALSMESDSGKMSKVQIERVKSGMGVFMELFKVYNNSFKIIEKELPNVSTEILNFDQPNLGMLNILLAKTGKLIKIPTSHGFVGNPIYHIRLWMMDREIEKYEANKDKKRLLEMKVLGLNMDKEADGVDKNKINKQIEYYEEKIQDLEYKIAKFES